MNNNLEIFNENILIKKLIDCFLEEKNKETLNKLKLNMSNDPNYNFNNELNEFFIFTKKYEFGSGDDILTNYKVTTKNNLKERVYLNIGKYSYASEIRDYDFLEHTEVDFSFVKEDEKLSYDITFHTGLFSFEDSHNQYYDKLANYKRILDPNFKQKKDEDIELPINDNEINDHIKLDPNQKNKEEYRENILYIIKKFNEDIYNDGHTLKLNAEITMYDEENIKELIEELSLNYFTPDSLAECIDRIKEETYLFLWNDLVAFNELLNDNVENVILVKESLSVGDMWQFIPEEHQKNIIYAMSNVKKIKIKNRIELFEITPYDQFGEVNEKGKLFLISSKNKEQKDKTKVFRDKNESEYYFKKFSNENKNNLRVKLPF